MPDWLPAADRHNEVLCNPGNETNVLNLTNSTTHAVALLDVRVGGQDNAIFTAKIDGDPILTVRNSWNQRAMTFPLGALLLQDGQVFQVTATNRGSVAAMFEASLNAKRLNG